MSSNKVRSSDGGFTLVELIVAMVITSILVVVILQLIRSEASILSYQGARQSVLQNSRATVDIIGGDLRGVPPVGVRTATESTLRVMVPRAWGIVCAGNGGTYVDAIFTSGLPAKLFTTVNSTTGLLTDISSTVGARSWAPDRSAANRAAVTSATVMTATEQKTRCSAIRDEADSRVAPGSAVGYRLNGNNFPATVVAGRPVFLYEMVGYTRKTTGDTTWVMRSNGQTSSGLTYQPLTGPVNGDSLQFVYYRLDPSNQPQEFVPTTADLDLIRRIKVRVAIRSANPSVKSRQISRDSVTVHLRNTL